MRKFSVSVILAVIFNLFCSGCEKTTTNVVNQLPSQTNPNGVVNTDATWQNIYQASILSVPKVNIKECYLVADFCYEYSHGTGFVVADNVVATNYHVAEFFSLVDWSLFPDEVIYYRLALQYPASNTLADNEFLTQEFTVEGVYADQAHDLAFLKVNTIDRQPLPLSSKRFEELQILDEVMAMGYPQEFDFVATTGKITATFLNDIFVIPWAYFDTKIIKIDAQIDGGNSGGPLLDKEGHVIGINFALYTPGWVTHSMALSADHLKKFYIPDLVFDTQPALPNPEDYQEYALLEVTSEINPIDELEEYPLVLQKDCLYRFEINAVDYIDPNPVSPIAATYDLFQNDSWLGWGDQDYNLVFPCQETGQYRLIVWAYNWITPDPGWYHLKVSEFCK